MVNEFVYIDITNNLYYTVLYLYSVSIGVASPSDAVRTKTDTAHPYNSRL